MLKAISTDREVTALKPSALRYERAVSQARGLSVVVYPTGVKVFVVRYVADGGERRRVQLGDYPGLGLADARRKAAALRVDVVDGADPAAERKARRLEARAGETMTTLARAYWAAAALGLHGGRRRPLSAETIARQQSAWRIHIQPAFGHLRFKEVKRAHVRGFMNELAAGGTLKPASLAFVGGVLQAVFAYALNEELIEANPALGLTRPLALESRSRLFDDAALRKLIPALMEAARVRAAWEPRDDPHARLEPATALAVLFLVATLTRRTEAAGALRSEIDLEAATWTIPAWRHKSRRVHVVPLSPVAIEILKEAAKLPGASETGYVFPASTDATTHVDPHLVTRAVSRLCERLGLPKGSPHDFRRSGATTLTGERYGIRRFIVGMVLGHTAQDGAAVTAVYDRNEYLVEKRVALNAWGRHLKQMGGGRVTAVIADAAMAAE